MLGKTNFISMFAQHTTLPFCSLEPLQVDQYQTFGISFKGKEYRVPGIFPPGENIADNGAGRAVYNAYHQLPAEEKQCVPGLNFTSDQLFWVRSLVRTHHLIIVSFQLGYSFYFCTTREDHERKTDYLDLLTEPPVKFLLFSHKKTLS